HAVAEFGIHGESRAPSREPRARNCRWPLVVSPWFLSTFVIPSRAGRPDRGSCGGVEGPWVLLGAGDSRLPSTKTTRSRVATPHRTRPSAGRAVENRNPAHTRCGSGRSFHR